MKYDCLKLSRIDKIGPLKLPACFPPILGRSVLVPGAVVCEFTGQGLQNQSAIVCCWGA